MVERYQRSKRKQKLLGNHQRCWIWGRNAVTEILTARRWRPIEVYLSDELSTETRRTVQAACANDVSFDVVPADELRRLCHSSEHQGYVAKMPPFPYADSSEVLDASGARPLYALLDGLHDPYNFGAVLRSAEVLGVDAVFVPARGQADVNSLVARTSAGAVNHVPIARVDDLGSLIDDLRKRGVRIVATDMHADKSPADCDLSRSCVIVIGNEGQGISPDILVRADVRVAIPQSGRVESLNAAVAAGILFYEAHRQRAARGET